MEQQLEEQGDDENADYDEMDVDPNNIKPSLRVDGYPEEVDFSFGDPYLNTMCLNGTEEDIASGGFGGCSPSYVDILTEFEDYKFRPFSAPPEVIFEELKDKVEESEMKLHTWEELKYSLEELYESCEPVPQQSSPKPETNVMDYGSAAASAQGAPILNIDHVIFHMPAPKEPRKPYPKYPKYPTPGYKSMRKDVRPEPKQFEQVVPCYSNYKITINETPKKEKDEHVFRKPPPKPWQPDSSQAVPSTSMSTRGTAARVTTYFSQLKLAKRVQCCLICFGTQWPGVKSYTSPSEKVERKVLLKENANYLMGKTDVVPPHLQNFLNSIGSNQNLELGVCTNCLPMINRAYRKEDSVDTIIGVMNIITMSSDLPDNTNSPLINRLADVYKAVLSAAISTGRSNNMSSCSSINGSDHFGQSRFEIKKETRSIASCTVTSETVNNSQASSSVSAVDLSKAVFQPPNISTHQPCMIIPGLLNAASTPAEFGPSFSNYPLYGTTPKSGNESVAQPSEPSMFLSLNACKFYSERMSTFQPELTMNSGPHSSSALTNPLGVIQQVPPGRPLSPNPGSVAEAVGRPAEMAHTRASRKSPKHIKDNEEAPTQPIETTIDPPSTDKFQCKEEFCGKIAPMSINTFIAHATFHYYRPLTCLHCEKHFHTYKYRKHWKRAHKDSVAFPRFKRIKFDPEVNWKCGNGRCQKTFLTSSSRDQHEYSEHSVESDGILFKQHSCSTCANDKRFKTWTEWKLHRVLEHPDVSARSCPSCNASFGLITKEGAEIVDLGAMLAHAECCSGKIAIACEFCGIPLMSLDELRQHLINAHEADPDRSFLCFICGEKFTFEELRIHMITCHEAKPFQ